MPLGGDFHPRQFAVRPDLAQCLDQPVDVAIGVDRRGRHPQPLGADGRVGQFVRIDRLDHDHGFVPEIVRFEVILRVAAVAAGKVGLAHALGETAPLLLIGMVAFVADYPGTPLQPSTALPVQIYMWANEAERAFVERTSGAIIILLLFLLAMNIGAVILRRRFERRW